MGKIRLFCLPYAGGSASVFNKWRTYLDSRIELVPLELAGRGRRMNQPFYGSVHEAADDIYSSISQSLDGCPYAFYGHSMGTVIVYEVCRRIVQNGRTSPCHVFASGRYAPHIKKNEKELHALPEDEFKEEILKIGGTPKQIFEDPQLTQIFSPVLRADYRIIECYKHAESNISLSCPITVLSGRSDSITHGLDQENEMLGWPKYTSGLCKMHEFDGGHFFIFDYIKEIANIINSSIAE